MKFRCKMVNKTLDKILQWAEFVLGVCNRAALHFPLLHLFRYTNSCLYTWLLFTREKVDPLEGHGMETKRFVHSGNLF